MDNEINTEVTNDKTDPIEKEEGDSKTFTQEQVNKMLAENKRSLRTQLDTTLNELTELKNKTKMSSHNQDELTNKIEELKNQLLSKEEIVKKERERLENKATEEISKVTNDRDTWRNRFETSTIETSIISAAASANAFNPTQILAMLSNNATLDEITEDGVGTGRFKVVVDFLTTDENGDSKRLTLSPKEAIKEMSQSEEYFNLFKDPATGGIGKKNVTRSGKTLDLVKLAKTDPAKYSRLRREGKINFNTGEVKE